MNERATIAAAQDVPLCDAEGPIPTFPPVPADPVTGRALAVSDEGRAARHAAVIRATDAIAEITDESDTDELWVEGMRDIDAQRPSVQKLFEGMY